MLQINLLQNQYIMLAFFGGIALVLLSALGYLAMWRARETEGAGPALGDRGRRGHMPWVLLVTYVAILVYAVVYVLMRAQTPPNW